MTDPADPKTLPDGLQFDRAEYAAPPADTLSCATCGHAIPQTYFQVNGQPTCERCRYDLELAQRSSVGGGTVRLLKATALGTLGGAVGAGLWFGIRWVTGGWEFGLIAIVVGFLVGAGVRVGSGGRGGVPYQLLAVFLTYTAIVSTYVPMIIEAFRTQGDKAAAATDASPGAGGGTVAPTPVQNATPDATPVSADNRADAPTQSAGGAQAAQQTEVGEKATAVTAPAAAFPDALLVLLFLGLVMLLAYVAPFLALVEGVSSIMLLAIIGFGVWQAWKMNRRTVLEITGPFRVGAAVPDTAAPVSEPDHL